MRTRANEILLDHYRRPRGRGELPGADLEIVDRTPVCGDEVRIMVRFEGDVAAEIRFVGEGCSVSQASASLLVADLAGRPVARIRERIRAVTAFLDGEEREGLGELEALSVVRDYPARKPCALLPWRALEKALAGRA